MNKNQQDKLVPRKEEGKHNEVDERLICNNRIDALQIFDRAVDKLLDINSWQSTADTSGSSAEFVLKDENGQSLFELPKKGNYIQIDIPGPGSKSGNGYDWVRIEEIIDQRDSAAENELVGFMVRPCSNPTKKENKTAHFFTEEATSTFIIERKSEIIYSRYFGRNEMINHETNMTDKVRNSLIGLAAKLGFSEIQWRSLIKGFLK
ncbi:MAG: hypothetical protein ABI266_04345 [Ginsengibacter sp.]